MSLLVYILQMNELILLQIGVHGRQGNGMKRSPLGLTRSNVHGRQGNGMKRSPLGLTRSNVHGRQGNSMKRSPLGLTRSNVHGHMTPKLDLETWQRRHSRLFWSNSFSSCKLFSIYTILSLFQQC